MRLKHLFLPLLLLPCYALADGRVLHVSNYTFNLQDSCSTDHKLNVQIGNELYCAPLTTDWSDNSLHVSFGGTTYTVCNGTCGGGEWVMPEEPEEPIVIDDPNCEWTQTNSNAYLLSDGNQYFDTGVTADTSVNIDVQVKVVNGLSARIFGTNSSSCWFDMTLDHRRRAQFRFGSANNAASTDFTEANSKKLLRFITSDSSSTKKRVDYYLNGVRQSFFTRTYTGMYIIGYVKSI